MKSICAFFLCIFLLPVACLAEPDLRTRLRPCEIKDVALPVFCGSLDIPEDRAKPAGRRLNLNMIVLGATGEEHLADPIFVLQGGPGQAATKLADFYAEIFGELRKQRDIVLVDQRGTGKSNPLQCELVSAEDGLHPYLGDLLPVDRIKACREKLSKIADLTKYTTEIAMDDLDEVRAWLGYEKINIYGTSYGTWAAFTYSRKFPDRVRALVMKALAPPTMRLSVTTAKDMQRALDSAIEDCLAQTACKQAFPNLREESRALMERLDKGPIPFKATDPKTGKTVDLKMSKQAFAILMRGMLHSPASASQTPLLMHSAANDRWPQVAMAAIKMRQTLLQEISIGMFLTIYCSEEIPLLDQSKIGVETAGTLHGDTWARQIVNACSEWPRGEVSKNFASYFRSEIPVLLISGALDPVTPPRWGDEAGRFFPNHHHVVVKKGAHSFNQMQGCVDRIITEFVRKGSPDGIDSSCANNIERPPFAVSAAEQQ